MSILTYHYRIKDATSGKHLLKMAYAVNTVWNYCQEVSLLALRREKRWLSAYDLHALVAGTSKDLCLSANTIQQVCTEYVTRRRQCKARRLKWRSRTRSLGWIPFKARYIRLDGDTVTYCGYRFRLWLSRPIDGWRDCVGAGRPRPSRKTGNFSQDARGRWYVNLQCAVPDCTEPLGEDEIGIDLGCVTQIACSDGILYRRNNLTQTYATRLAIAQRAGKSRRTRALHAKIANIRADWTHKVTTAIARRARLIVVGDVSSVRLAQTPFAKSTYDAAWGIARHQFTTKPSSLLGSASQAVNCSPASLAQPVWQGRGRVD